MTLESPLTAIAELMTIAQSDAQVYLEQMKSNENPDHIPDAVSEFAYALVDGGAINEEGKEPDLIVYEALVKSFVFQALFVTQAARTEDRQELEQLLQNS